MNLRAVWRHTKRWTLRCVVPRRTARFNVAVERLKLYYERETQRSAERMVLAEASLTIEREYSDVLDERAGLGCPHPGCYRGEVCVVCGKVAV